MAKVFLAVARGRRGFNKLVVVKELRHPDDAEHLEMFLDEARLCARIQHPNIVHTYEVGDEHGVPFLAMEYLDGQSLHALLTRLRERGSPLPELVAAHVACQVLKGLHYVHELCDYDGTPLGIVHRDVSPQNVFVTYGGEVKLLDFGIAKTALSGLHTATGILKGKPRYMAPEQATGRALDRRADVFATGIVLWEMIAGRRLFEGDALTTITLIATIDAPSLRTVVPEVSPALEVIVATALARSPEDRYPTAEAMRLALEEALRAAGHREGDAALAALTTELFEETRTRVRASIQQQIESLPSTGASSSALTPTKARSLAPPRLDADGAVGATTILPLPPTPEEGSTAAVVVTPGAPRRSTFAAIFVAGGLLAAGVFAARAHSTESVPPRAAASTNAPEVGMPSMGATPSTSAPPVGADGGHRAAPALDAAPVKSASPPKATGESGRRVVAPPRAPRTPAKPRIDVLQGDEEER